MKAYRGSRGIVPLILKHGTIWRRMVNFTPRPLYRRYPLNRRLVWLTRRSGRFCRIEKFLAPTGTRNPGHAAGLGYSGSQKIMNKVEKLRHKWAYFKEALIPEP
jgi:hypothetical protein